MARILVVDDAHSPVRAALLAAGHDVSVAPSTEDAVHLAGVGVYDAVLTDLQRRDRRADDWIPRLRAAAPDASIVTMVPAGDVAGAAEMMRLGASDCLPSPCDPEDLLQRVGLVVGERRAAPATAARNDASHGIVGSSRPMRELLELVAKVAETDSTVLITGETGTGKELVGRAVHRASHRAGRPLCAVNSAGFPETLLESELFGHRRGAFTGAVSNKKGLFEHASFGTVFLDEVGEMPLAMQAKLLRFLQTGEIRPVGSETTRCVDVRLIAATNRNLETAIDAGVFREDLYYRLAVIPIHVPPLREHREDVPLLAGHFLERFAGRLGKRVTSIEPAAMQWLVEYEWPGNVRELENLMERCIALCRGDSIGTQDLPARVRREPERLASTEFLSLQDLERKHILGTLDRVSWNRKRAAEILKISTTTLWRRLKEFGVEEAPRRSAAPL